MDSTINENAYELDTQRQTDMVAQSARNSAEISIIAAEIDPSNPDTITSFGNKTAHEISRFSDMILDTIKTTSLENPETLLLQLNKIMNKFDASDFSEEQKSGLIVRIMKKTKDSVDALLNKYTSMGGEMEKIYAKLKEYESEIKKSNSLLDSMFEKNMGYYEALEKYIAAGAIVLQKIQSETIPALESRATLTNDQIDRLNLSNARNIEEMLQQRIYDLELAKNVSMQTMPQIRLIQRGNYNLVRKINSAFIITIPIFKQSLIQAITLKRQLIQARAMAALDEKTNELLVKNSENTALQSKMLAQMSSGGALDIGTLEKTWNTIVTGIEETRQIHEDAKRKRAEGTQRLHQIQDDFKKRAGL